VTGRLRTADTRKLRKTSPPYSLHVLRGNEGQGMEVGKNTVNGIDMNFRVTFMSHRKGR
jgi:hypothetical protein